MTNDFEACLYNPAGTIRTLNPVTNMELQNLSVPLLNMTTYKAITKGNIEVHTGRTLSPPLILIYFILICRLVMKES